MITYGSTDDEWFLTGFLKAVFVNGANGSLLLVPDSFVLMIVPKPNLAIWY